VTGLSRALLALIVGQICLHACMAGLRLAAPLQALREGRAEWVVGVLLALFALAPIVLALPAGRLADRRGYHRPLKVAVTLTTLGGVCAVTSTLLAGLAQLTLLAGTAVLAGAGANVGLIAIQRSAGRAASSTTDLKRIFSWLGLAPALANMTGPLLAGALIDIGGFRLAYAALAALPAIALATARAVPRESTPRSAERRDSAARSALQLLEVPGLRRLLIVNWLISTSWDVHTFVLPILGHERGFSASAIGAILGVFAAMVAAVRVVIPLVAQRLREGHVLVVSMLTVGIVFAIYPVVMTASAMAACAAVLGVALGAVQPMIMSTLHQITPHERHGEAIALRSIAINLSSTVMPLLFGAAGAALGAGALFWVMGAAVAAGSIVARRVGAPHREAGR
jgi:MFS family permease